MRITDATKMRIADSLRELAANKPVDKITIAQIMANCGLSATTFYNHFSNKQMLIAWIYNSQTQEVYSLFKKGKISWKDALEKVAETLMHDRSFYIHCLIHTEGPDALLPATTQEAFDIVYDTIASSGAETQDRETSYAVAVYANGVSRAMSDWLVNDPDLPPQKLAEYLYKAVPDKLKPYLWAKED